MRPRLVCYSSPVAGLCQGSNADSLLSIPSLLLREGQASFRPGVMQLPSSPLGILPVAWEKSSLKGGKQGPCLSPSKDRWRHLLLGVGMTRLSTETAKCEGAETGWAGPFPSLQPSCFQSLSIPAVRSCQGRHRQKSPAFLWTFPTGS